MKNNSDLPFRKDTAKNIKGIREILRDDISDDMASELDYFNKVDRKDRAIGMIIAVGISLLIWIVIALLLAPKAHAQEITASWYSVESLKQEGTWKYSHGRMANGHIFSDNNFTCASRMFPLGTMLRVENSISKGFVIVRVTDRIGKRFAKKRIDLSKRAFEKLAETKEGLIKVNVEKICHTLKSLKRASK